MIPKYIIFCTYKHDNPIYGWVDAKMPIFSEKELNDEMNAIKACPEKHRNVCVFEPQQILKEKDTEIEKLKKEIEHLKEENEELSNPNGSDY